jgi:uncharacterized membrane-anchored protein YitT (DUF2179 family)
MQINVRSFLLRFVLITAGALIGAVAVIVFLEPSEIAPAGITGVAVIMSITLGTPIGLVVLLGNIPIQYYAYRTLGGWKPIAWTIYVLIVYSAAVDLLQPYLQPVSDDRLLNTLFGGIVGGIGGGLVYRFGANFGGTSTLAQVFQRKLGLPISTTYLYANLGTVLLAGLVLGWEGALYALVALSVEGAASDYILEGPSVIRTAVIVTNRPREVADGILFQLQRGVTSWEATGMYTGQPRTILYVTVARFQIDQLRSIVAAIDPSAFIVIGQGHVAFGEGFRPVKQQKLIEEQTGP